MATRIKIWGLVKHNLLVSKHDRVLVHSLLQR